MWRTMEIYATMSYRDYKVLYHKPNWDGLDLFPDVSVRLVWPTWVFSVLAAVYPQRELNFFEICILRMLRLTSCNVEILCERTCLREGFIRLILRRLRDQGYVKDFHLTERGTDVLDNTIAEEPEIRNVFVFQDCLSKKFYPIIASKLDIKSGKAEDTNVWFRVSKKQKIDARMACPQSPYEKPKLDDVKKIIHEFGNLNIQYSINTEAVYSESPQSIEISRARPELVWVYSEARLGKNNHRIYVSDPFLDLDSVILSENMFAQELNGIATELKQRGVTLSGEMTSGDEKICRYESLDYLLRPLDAEVDPSQLQSNLSTDEIMGHLSDYYYAMEQAFKKMLAEYDYTNLANSLRGTDEETLKSLLIQLAADLGLRISRQRSSVTANAGGHSDALVAPTVPDDQSVQETDNDCSSTPTTSKPWLKNKLILEHFFFFRGSRFQDCLSGEANLRVWLGLAMLVNTKMPLPALKKLFQVDFLLYIDYLADFRNAQDHGVTPKRFPDRDQLAECLNATRDIVSCLLPDLNISAQTYDNIAELSEKDRIARYYKAEADLIRELGYARTRNLPKSLREKLIAIKFHTLCGNQDRIFSNIQVIDNLMFQIARAEKIPSTPGVEVLRKARSNFPSLPEIFWEINPQKLVGTIAGVAQSLRASLVCLLAFGEKHRGFFTPERLQYLEQVLRLRTHNWREGVSRQPFSEIASLGEQTISFAVAIIKEYRYDET